MPPVDIPLNAKLFTNVRESALTRAAAAMENAYVVENGGLTRFPPLRTFATLPGSAEAPVFLWEWRDSLIAVTSRGRLFTVTRNGVVTDATGVPLSGGQRPTFAETDDELLTAAGGPILKYSGTTTAKLSDSAPETTHVGYVDGYTMAIEPRSGRFYHSSPGQSATWEPLDVFTAEGKPDNLNALFISSYRELLLTGNQSVEQFERLPNGDRPFFRRWASGETVLAPYTIAEADQGVWFINSKREFVRLSGQTGQPRSDDIQRDLSTVADWTGAWAAELFIDGQKFLVLQIPLETNAYGTKGVTLLLDIRSGRWSSLYAWDEGLGLPVRWPGWSVRRIWGRVFVGGNGVIYELTPDRWDGTIVGQRMLWRSGHFEARQMAGTPALRVDDIRIRVVRGEHDQYDRRAKFWIRMRKDNGPWSRYIERDFGAPGERSMHLRFGGFGRAEALQFEIGCTDAGPVQAVAMQADVTPLPR
jgi:hypothetical protein